jgi:DNA-binding NtrC family response regulator
MITGFATVETAVQSLKLGAVDYVKKPLDFEMLNKIVQNAIHISSLKLENKNLKEKIRTLSPRIITRNEQMQEVMNQVHRLAPTDLSVLIIGENGSGKELIAEALHESSHRASHKLIKINCASFPETLLDNELFGHERGAYTGADSTYKGLFEQANGGSLFMDEIGDMPLAVQSKILRALQNREVRRIGGTDTLSVDVRFIAATNQNLLDLIEKKKFREDLYYRLSTAVVAIPPLRNRKDDIPYLVQNFIEEYCFANGLESKNISDEVVKRLIDYNWPGNIRELKNIINYACAISDSNVITLHDLPPPFLLNSPETKAESFNLREQSEKMLIIKMLQQTRYNKKITAERLSMSRKTLYNKLARYGIETE